MKRAISLLAAVVFCMSAFVGCGNDETGSGTGSTGNSVQSGSTAATENDTDVFKDITEPVTLKAVLKTNPVNGDIPEMWFWDEIEKLSKIKFEVSAIEASVFHDRKTLMIISNQLPDMFLGYAEFDSGEVMKYGEEGVFVDLKDYIPEMKNLQKVLAVEPNTLKGATTPDGSIYSLPCFNTRSQAEGDRIFINTTWLDNLGLSMPKTMEEFRNVLVAFRDRDPDGDGVKNTIPISGVGYSILPLFRSAYGFVDDFDVIDGKVKYFPMERSYTDYFDTLNQFYMDNLIDHEMISQTDEQFKTKARSMKVGVFAYSSADTAVGDEKEKWSQYEAMDPITAVDGVEAKFGLDTGIYEHCAIITKANQHIEESLAFLDFLYTETGTTMLRVGPEKGKWDGEGGYTLNSEGGAVVEVPKNYESEWMFVNAVTPCINILPCYMPSQVMMASSGDEKSQHLKKQLDRIFNNGRYKMPEYMYTSEEAAKVNELLPYIQSDVQAKIPDYIIGVKDVQEIVNDQAQWKKMGIDEVIQIKQAGYDRYAAAE